VKSSAVNPTIISIFLTGHSEYTFDALQMHCSGYLLKPLTPEKVLHEMSHLRFPIQGRKNDDRENLRLLYEMAAKMQKTLDTCRAAVLDRTPYVITQQRIDLVELPR